ncbi:MAG: hypothetical protein JNJ54_29520 [Myxococcaceae bacterium]|nr:hypothetical protein [Myxococcaceae bacterium]
MNLFTRVLTWCVTASLTACGGPTSSPSGTTTSDPATDPRAGGAATPNPTPTPTPTPTPNATPDAGLQAPAGTPWPALGAVALKSHAGQFMVAEGGGGGVVNANRASIGVWETFTLEAETSPLVHGGRVHLKAHGGQYLQAEQGGGGALGATGTTPGAWATFTLRRVAGAGAVKDGDEVALETSSGHFVVAEGGGGDVVRANRTATGPWETFRLVAQAPGVLPVDVVVRHGRVRGQGRAFVDDDGPFNALGATWMSALWMYRNDRARCERWLDALSKNGFHYFRALGVVGDVTAADYWDGREIDWRAPGYAADLAGLTDLAYDRYGLRVEWTLIGDGQKNIPNEADRYALVDTFLAMSRGREHKIMHFELANEAWQNGFAGDSGRAQLRALTRYMNDRTDVLVAASAPDGYEQATVEAIYGGGVADLATPHFDRDSTKIEGSWRAVRQPWEWRYYQNVPELASNNEPIGPGASVASETNPVKLVSGALASWVSGVGAYVFHTRAGVRGDTDVWTEPGFTAFKPLASFVPPGLAAWTQKNAHWADAPFKPYAREPNGTLVPNAMWPDTGGTGTVRAYGVVQGVDFVVFPFGIKDRFTLEPRRNVEFDVIDLMTGQVLRHETLAAGQQFDLQGAEAFVLKGRYR